MLTKNHSEPFLVQIIRIITGIVFLFSAYVKGVDPMGTDYRVIDYLEAYGWYGALDYSFLLTIIVISAEYLLGISIIFRLKPRLASLGLLLIMIFFTIVTFFDALYELVPDCGCFGDAIKLSNWGTFYKNIVLLGFALIIYISRKKINPIASQSVQYITIVIVLVMFEWFIYHNLNHLPMNDFRDWKVGNDMKSTGKETVVTFLAYQNKNTGELKEYVSPNYPWNDSVWMSEWEFVSQRVDDSNLELKHGLLVEDVSGNNVTEYLIENPDYQLLLTVYDIQEANSGAMILASELFNDIYDTGINFAMVSSSTSDDLDDYLGKYNMDYDIYYGDDIELKAMIRSNPGLILLKDGMVIDKWHYNDFPTKDQVELITTDD